MDFSPFALLGHQQIQERSGQTVAPDLDVMREPKEAQVID